LTPDSVRALLADGHEVWIETGAGAGIGSSDADYEAAGAHIAGDGEEAFRQAELIIKVKEPNAAERARLQPRQALFTYLHLASDEQQTHDLIASKAVCIAYETVTDASGHLPLLTPMSVIAGHLAVQEAVTFLEKHHGGMGVLLGGAPGVEPESVVIIGGGVVGSSACQTALGLGARVTVLDRSEQRLQELVQQFDGRITAVFSTIESVAEHVPAAALVVGAVLSPGGRAAHIISSELVRKMRPGSVIADVAIDQGGCCENSKPTTHLDPTFVVDGVIHYCVANIPGAVPRTSSKALNTATLPYIRELANKGVRQALRENPHLLNGLNVCCGKVTQAEVAADLGLEYVPAKLVIDDI
jgi:alanine dehydrogenase